MTHPIDARTAATSVRVIASAFDRLEQLIWTTGALTGLPVPDKQAIYRQIETIREALERAQPVSTADETDSEHRQVRGD